MLKSILVLFWLLAETFRVAALDLSPGIAGGKPIWGVEGGLVWAVPPGMGANHPRGLIRLAYPILSNQVYELVNFIAIEPVVGGRRGYSELETSQLDGIQGKRLWSYTTNSLILINLSGGKSNAPALAKEMVVKVSVEKFDNGAHVNLVIRQRADRPDEIELSVFTEPDSQPLDYCILTATMGNFARTRQLWLKDKVVSSLQLYPDYKAANFAPTQKFPAAQLLTTADGRRLAAITTDEDNPAAAYPFPGKTWWYYGGFRVTQYWAKPAGPVGEDLSVAVNGRYTYWLSQQPVPGGIAYENFELNERFQAGQKFIFGITRQTPRELGF